MDSPAPSIRTPLAGDAPTPAKRRLGRWLSPGLCLLVPIAVLAGVLWLAASNYYLDIPMQAMTPQQTRLFYWHENDRNGLTSTTVGLPHDGKVTHAHFPVGNKNVAALILDTTLGEGEVFVGAPVLRCAADDYLRYDVHFRDFKLSDIQGLHGMIPIVEEGDFLHVITKPQADISICAIKLPEPMPLAWSGRAFARNFVPLALGWCLVMPLVFFALGRAVRRWPSLRQSWPGMVRGLLASPVETSPLIPKWEKRAVVVIFVLVAVLQANAVLHGGTKGQDYPTLYRISENIALHPERPWLFGAQDPPVFVLTNALIIWLSHGVHSQEFCGAFNLLFNLAGLWVFIGLTRRFVTDSVWRVTLLTLVAFLPVRLIHTVVLAGDALTLWPFFGLVWIMVAITDAGTSRNRRRWLACAGAVLLTVGVLTKYTFMSALVAVLLILVQLARRRRIPWREAGLLLALALVLPIGVVIGQQRLHPDFSNALQIRWTGASDMGVRDIVGLHQRDPHIFRAPPYNESLAVEYRWCNGKPWSYGLPYELLASHQYSYLALNHLAIFTDPLNIFQYDPTDFYFGARNSLNQRLMALAVKTAVPVTLACIAAMALLSGLLIASGLISPVRSRPDLEAVYLLAFGWFSNIVVFLPFIPPAYYGGYWTPRLTLPGLLLFLLLTVYVLDRLLPAGRVKTVASWLTLGYVVCQSAVQVCFLIPWGKIYW